MYVCLYINIYTRWYENTHIPRVKTLSHNDVCRNSYLRANCIV